MTSNANTDKIQCPKCRGMMIPSVVKEGCGGNRTERICPLCGYVLSKKGMACCFIATAAYGTDLNEKVNILCIYRDEHLLKSNFGKKFVNSYYKHSPRVASLIETSESLKFIVRLILYPIVFVVGKIINCRK